MTTVYTPHERIIMYLLRVRMKIPIWILVRIVATSIAAHIHMHICLNESGNFLGHALRWLTPLLIAFGGNIGCANERLRL